MTAPRATVIVVTFNSRAHFKRLREALERQSAPFRLIVLDNASRSEERPLPEDLPGGAEIIQSEVNLGFAGGNNLAAERVDTPFLVLLNPDAFPAPDWLSALLDTADRHPRAGSVGSLQIAANDETRLDGFGDCYAPMGAYWRGGHGAKRAHLSLDEGEVFSACAAAALYRSDAWREAGGFDPAYFCYCEDIDLGFRLRLLGWRVVQSLHASVTHIGGGSSQTASDFSDHHAMRNGIWTFFKNTPSVLLLLATPAHAGLLLRYLAGAARARRWRATSSGIAAGLKGLPEIFEARRRVQRTRRATTLEIARAMTWSPLTILRGAPDVRPIRR